MADAEVGDDGFGDDPTVARLEAAFAERVGKEAVAVRAVGHDGQPDRAAAPRPPGHGRCWWAGASTSWCGRRAPPARNAAAQLVTLDDADGTIDPAEVARLGRRRRRRLGRRRRRCSSRTPTARSAAGCGRSSGCGAVAAAGLPCTSTAPGCGTPPSPPAPRWPSGPRRPPRSRAASPRAWARRSGRCWPVRADLIAQARVGAQAARRRDAPGRHPRRRRAVALDRVDRLADDHERARRLAKAAAERWPGGVDVGARPHQHRPHRGRRPAAGARAPRGRRRAGGARAAPTRCGS